MNRNLRLSAIQAIGFDMDHTLALYDTVPFEELAFEEAKRKLVTAGLDPELATMRYDASFVIRGLVLDKARGNILKMDQHRYVARAFHGTRPLPDEMRKRLYQRRPIRFSRGDYVTVDSPFSLPEIDLYAQLVDLQDAKRHPRDYRSLYQQVRGAIDEAHADGSIKSEIAREPERYLRVDPDLPATLHRMKEHGFRLFLLTNSEAEYTAEILGRLLDGKLRERPRWTDFFDIIVVRAGKPAFFRSRREARPIRLAGAGEEAVEGAKVFAGGSVGDLERRLGCGGDKILYFGDHTYGDILKSKRVRLWRTAMIVQELQRELEIMERQQSRRNVLRRQMDRLDGLLRVSDLLERVQEGVARPPLEGGRRLPVGELLASVGGEIVQLEARIRTCLLYTSPSPRDSAVYL
ncbi:MAG: HAD-IG family 5'-nucleotidase, partial [Candidatus Eisenbacteria bacterium]|nr:HAD-IG family 5'-nucleotidase [Candidatus Eisenbacteria bacterium]